jgi:hypothetical protein
MHALALMICLIARAAPEVESDTARKAGGGLAQLRRMYREDAEKYRFQREGDGQPALELVAQPIMRWATDDDWSGDVFLWNSGNRPAVLGCILSGPANNDQRTVYHEFHLLADEPIAPVAMQTAKRWQPKTGLSVQPIPDAPAPSASAAVRLTQMRQFSRQFTASMHAESDWELRSLPQPLHRYGDSHAKTGVIDGALFAYVWSKGTDPEVILLVECQRTSKGDTWYYAPVRFSTRTVWLTYAGKEVWRVESHREPQGNVTEFIYTTAYARTVPRPDDEAPTTSEKPK